MLTDASESPARREDSRDGAANLQAQTLATPDPGTPVPRLGRPPTIAIAVPYAVNVRDVLRTDTFRTLKEAGARLVILSPAYNEPEFIREFAADNVHIEPLHPYSPGNYEQKLSSLRCTLFADLTKTTSILSDGSPPRTRLKRAAMSGARVATRLIGRRKTEDLLALASRTLFPGLQYAEVLRKYRPDLVVVTRVFGWAADEQVLKCAANLGFPTMLLVASWDNLTKGVFPTRPDRLVVWNSIMYEEAQELHGFRPDQIFIGGVPQFDIYADKSRLPDRAALYRRLGADPALDLITFTMADPKVVPDEADVVEMVWTAAREGQLARPCQVLARVHPQFADRAPALLERLRSRPGLLVDVPGRSNSAFPDRDPTTDDMIHLAATLAHSAVVVNTRSTIAIDAAALDRPVVCAAFDGRRTLPYHQSVRRFLDYDHYRKMLELGGVPVARSFDELMTLVNKYLLDPGLDREARARLVERECRAIDGQTGRRVGQFVLRSAVELGRAS